MAKGQFLKISAAGCHWSAYGCGMMPLVGRHNVLSLAAAALLAATHPALAEPLEPPTQRLANAQQEAGSEPASDYNGEDFTRPQNRFDMRFEDNSSGATTRTDRRALLLRWDGAVALDSGWKTSWLAQLPLVDRTTASSADFGIGDAAFQGVLSREIDARWAFGFGARLIAPTAEDTLGSGKWQIMPGFGVRYSFLEFGSDTYFVPKIRYALSFAGDPSRRNLSEPQIAPTFNIGLPDRWFVTLYPSYDIRINYGDPLVGQTGRLFLPFDLAIGQKVTDKLVISLEAAVPIIKDYPVYRFKTELRAALQF